MRPPSLNGSYGKEVNSCYGKEVNGIQKPGLVQMLQEVFLDKYVDCIKNSLPVKHTIILFKKEDDIADVNDALCEMLPEYAEDPETCPWCVNHSSVGPATAQSIRSRSGEISLYLSTSVMLMGIDCHNIDIVVMVKPFSMIHSLVQACGRGGRKMMDKFRRRVVFILLFNNSDIAANVEISPAVCDLCLTKDCLKEFMMKYFGSDGKCGGSWCCSNCDSAS